MKTKLLSLALVASYSLQAQQVPAQLEKTPEDVNVSIFQTNPENQKQTAKKIKAIAKKQKTAPVAKQKQTTENQALAASRQKAFEKKLLEITPRAINIVSATADKLGKEFKQLLPKSGADEQKMAYLGIRFENLSEETEKKLRELISDDTISQIIAKFAESLGLSKPTVEKMLKELQD